MGYGFSLILITAGAILTWGVEDTATGVDIAAVGVILMLVGLIGLLLTLAFWSSFSPFADNAPFRRRYAGSPRYDDDVVVDRAPRRTVVVREEPTTVIREQPRRDRTVVIRDPDDTV